MNSIVTRTAAAAFALPLALGLAACSAEQPEDPAETGSAEAPQAEDTADSEGATPTEEPEDANETEEAEEADTSADDSADSSIKVEAEGQGPIGLRTSSTPQGSAEKIEGKFIVGQGSCFALTATDDRPSLLVFSEDASFTLRKGKPAVTTDDLGTVKVGSKLDAEAVEMDPGDVEGIPERCSHGVDEVLVVSGK